MTPFPIPLHPAASRPAVLVMAPAKMQTPRVPKAVGRAVCAAAMLGVAVDTLLEPGVLEPGPATEQAKAVREAFRAATWGALPTGIPEPTARKIRKQSTRVVDLGGKIMAGTLFCPPFVIGRIMAAWMFLEHSVVHHGLGADWRKLVHAAGALLDMLVGDMPEDEADMGRLAWAMFEEFEA